MCRAPHILGLLVLGSISQPLLATDHVHQQLNAHLHGAAELNMVVEQSVVAVELITPADNILGFEHKAASQADKQKLEQTLAMLEKGNWIRLTSAAKCTLESWDIDTGLIDDEHHDEHASEHHDEDHDEDRNTPHDADSEEESHSEFHISYQYRCQSPNALVGAELLVWQQFEGFERVKGQLISPQGQQRLDLTQDDPIIRF